VLGALAEFVEEGADRLPQAPLADPDRVAGVVVGDDGEVLVALAVAHLVDADPNQSLQAGTVELPRYHPLDDVADRGPGDVEQVLHCGLVHLAGHPGHQVLEVTRESRVVLRPWNRLGYDAVLGAVEPAQHRADDDAPPAEREVAPVPHSPIVARAGRERAARAAVATVPLRHVHNDPDRAEFDVPHERTLQTQQLVEYRGDAHRLLRGFEFSQTTKYHGFSVRISSFSPTPRFT
jgi:hypothetical protein